MFNKGLPLYEYWPQLEDFKQILLCSVRNSKKQPDGTKEYRDLIKAGWTHIVRHVKIQTDSNPYDPAWNEYLHNRKKKKIYSNKDGRFVEDAGWLHDE